MPLLLRRICLLMLLVTVPALGQINLDGSFDHGSLASWSTAPLGGFGGETQVNLVGRDNFYGNGRWRWLYFKADGVQGEQPTFSISENFAGGASLLDGSPMFYSYDNENWEVFDNNGRTSGDYQFSNNTEFTQDEVYVAYSVPYSYGRSASHTESVLATPWATPTLSGDANGVIGQSPGGVDDLGRTIDPRNIYGYRVTDPSVATEGKTKIVLTTGMHAAETGGRWTFQGMVDWLVSDDPGAATLRQLADVYAYPTMNPDGVFAGNSRATVQNPNRDPNGLWNPSLWGPHQDIAVNGEAMIADVTDDDNDVLAFIDFHSTWPTSFGDDFGFIEIDQGDNLSPFWVELKRLQPNVGEDDSTSTGWISANFGEFFLGAEVDVTFETQMGLPRTQDYYLELGANFGRAFLTALVPEPSSAVLVAMVVAAAGLGRARVAR